MTSLGHHVYEKHFRRLTLTKTPTDGSGYFEGLASTWDLDRDRERFAFGAWADSITEWESTGSMPPVFYNHRTAEPDDIIGRVRSMQETVDGLRISGQLDLGNPRAVSVYARMLAGTLDSMSVGFIAEERSGNVIEKADLLEVTLTPVPSNPFARVSAVKNTTTGSDADVRLYTDPNDPAHWSRRIDELEKSVRPPLDSGVVDAFVLETRELMVREKLAEAEHANARLVSTTAVVGAVPVRVDARMRPVSSEDGSPSV
jgi:HK97 family phage prohead protease